MKFLVAQCLSVLCLLLSFGQAERYKMALEERGTRFSEEIDIDERGNAEVFRVPAHNDVNGADFYHDFKMRVTATRILSQKVCYISEIDPTLSSPGKLKADLDRAVSKLGKLLVKTESYVVKVMGSANRLFLPKEILNFCGTLPIYNTSQALDTGTAGFYAERLKRETILVKEFLPCDKDRLLKTVENCPQASWNVRCKWITGTCYYWVTCKNTRKGKKDWSCLATHIQKRMPSCCEYTCP